MGDMGLNKASIPDECRKSMADDAAAIEGDGLSSGSKAWTSEQMRAAAGCVYASSMCVFSLLNVPALSHNHQSCSRNSKIRGPEI